MSLADVQARTAEISARLAALAPPAPLRTSLAGPADGAFANRLRDALSGGSGVAATAATPATSGAGPASGSTGDAVLATARSYLGVPYLWGGTTRAGIDCSGFVQAVYREHGIDLPRVSKDQARAGRAVPPAQARPGDLVAFDNSSARAGIDHIGIYLGDGKWIAAPRSGDVVKIQNVDLSKAVTIRRVLPDAPVGAVAAPTAVAAADPAAAWTARLPAAARPYVPALLAAGRATGVDPQLLAAVAWTESNFNGAARSPAGAVGLMQLMPATARGLGVNPADPTQAAFGGARYLAEQLASHGGRTDLALAAYNAGPGAVRKHGGVPPYPETRAYISRVLDRYDTLRGTA